MGRQFHAVRASKCGPVPDLPRRPLIIVVNHPSWWDPLIGLILSGSMPAWRVHHAPIESSGLAQYPFLERIGCFGIEAGTTRGGLQFLRTSRSILARPESVLWITAQGEFVDPRDRPITLKPGIGHLAHHLSDAIIVPMAIEYPFWNDRCPEALVRFGPMLSVEPGHMHSPGEWTTMIERALEAVMDDLAEESRRRDPDAFATVLEGTSGVGGVYDIWRRLKAALGGKQFRAEHAARPSADPATRPVPDRARARPSNG